MVLQDKRSEASVEAVRVVVILLLQMKAAPTAAAAARRPRCSCSNVQILQTVQPYSSVKAAAIARAVTHTAERDLLSTGAAKRVAAAGLELPAYRLEFTPPWPRRGCALPADNSTCRCLVLCCLLLSGLAWPRQRAARHRRRHHHLLYYYRRASQSTQSNVTSGFKALDLALELQSTQPCAAVSLEQKCSSAYSTLALLGEA